MRARHTYPHGTFALPANMSSSDALPERSLNFDLLRSALPRFRDTALSAPASPPFSAESRLLDSILGPAPRAPASISASSPGGLVGALSSRLASVEATVARLRADLLGRDRELAALRRTLGGTGSAVGEAINGGGDGGGGSGDGDGDGDGGSTSGGNGSGVALNGGASAAVAENATSSSRAATAGATSLSAPRVTDVTRKELLAAKADAQAARAEAADFAASLRAAHARIVAMESFLRDYGLVWVGPDGAEGDDADDVADEGVDVRLLLQRIMQLNALVAMGDGPRVVSKNGAHQIVTGSGGCGGGGGERLPIVVFRDGLLIRRGPFRPFSDAPTRAFAQDVLDGFFPFELKDMYPDGVTFDVTDRSSVSGAASNSTPQPGAFVSFSGDGQSLGGGSGKGGGRGRRGVGEGELPPQNLISSQNSLRWENP